LRPASVGRPPSLDVLSLTSFINGGDIKISLGLILAFGHDTRAQPTIFLKVQISGDKEKPRAIIS
jgi:hypothetical protein